MVCLNPKIAYQRRFFPLDCRQNEKKLKKYNRISFTYKKGWQQIELPCGECPACKLKKANEWATRIDCEAKTWNNKGIFVTLTYDNKHLPTTDEGHMTLRKRDVQLFKKRLRKYVKKHNEALHSWINPKTLEEEKPIRTFECGEYGPKNGRPHYHQIIFNWIPNDLVYWKTERGCRYYKSKKLKKIWGNGFVVVGLISYESASYVARYTMKKQGLAKTKRKYYTAEELDEETGEIILKTKYKIKEGKIKPEFITMSTSPGIGYAYFQENFEKIKKNNGILINVKGTVKLKAIPRYFRKLWESKDWQDYERWKYNNRILIEEEKEKLIKSYNLPEEWTHYKKEQFVYNEQLDKQKHKWGLLRRDNIGDNDNDDDDSSSTQHYSAI